MTNKYVMDGFNEVYNQFWKRYRDKLPQLDSYDEWNQIYDSMVELQKKYPLLEEALRKMMIELDKRSRENANMKL